MQIQHFLLWQTAFCIVADDMHYLCITKMHSELQRAITLTELAPSPFYSNTNVNLVNINVFANSDEIPSLSG